MLNSEKRIFNCYSPVNGVKPNEWGYSCKCIELVEHMAKVDGKI